MSQKQDNSELIQKILTGTRWAAMLRFSAQIFSWLSTIIVVRFISPADYGLNNMLQSPLEVMMLLSTVGLDVALVQSKKLDKTEMRSTFGWLLVINGFLFLAYFFGGALLAAYFKEPSLDLLAKVLAFIFLLVPFRVIPNALLDRELKFKLRAQVELGAMVCSTILTLSLAVMGAGIWALVLGILANRVLQTVLLMVFEPWFIWPSLDYKIVHRLMAFGGVAMASGVVAMLSGMMVSLIAGRQLGAELLGIYAVAIQFAMLPLAKIMPIINQSLVPAFSKFQSQRDVAGHYFGKAMGIASLILVPAMVGMACIADAFVHTLLGAKWVGVALPLAVLSIMMLMRIVTLFLWPVMTSMGHPDISFKSNLLKLGLLIPATLMGVRYSVMGVVVAIFTTEMMVTLFMVILSKRVLNISFADIFRSLRPAFVSSAIMAMCVLSVRAIPAYSGSFLDLLLGVGVGAISYYLALRLLFTDIFHDAVALFLGKKLSN